MSLSTRRPRRRLVSEINVVPYIDVMLVLLVIFMITAPLLNQGVNVDLPHAKAQALKSEQEPIVVSVNASGEYFLNIAKDSSKKISNAALVESVQIALVKAKSQNATRAVLVKGDKGTSYGNVVKAMVLLQQAGVSNVGLMTQDI